MHTQMVKREEERKKIHHVIDNCKYIEQCHVMSNKNVKYTSNCNVGLAWLFHSCGEAT